MDAVETAWLAGLYEGEGSLFGFKNSTMASGLRVAMTDEDVIKKCLSVAGVGSVTGPHHKAAPRQPIWTWSVYKRDDLLAVLLAIRPHLGQRRRQRVDQVLERLELGDLRRRAWTHGTTAGYYRHHTEGALPPCEPCLKANSEKSRERRRLERERTNSAVAGSSTSL